MVEYKKILERQRAFFQAGNSKKITFRKSQLLALQHWICENEKLIISALKRDLNKSHFEAYATEIGLVKEELSYALKRLSCWAKPKTVLTPITQFPARSFIYPEPYGVVLIMSPWNYPFQLTVAPLIGAISAGNCVVIKPSAYSSHTTKVISKMVHDLFLEDYITVITGGRKENEALLNQKFDYIFFTGSTEVGKYVMKKASANLTPVSLELGGKSPCIVDETANLKLAAKRIIWGKLLNAGQTCVAPDYLLVHHSVKEQLVLYMKMMIDKMYGANPCQNPEYPAIINDRHFKRLCRLMQDTHILHGGDTEEKSRHIAPTIMDQISWESPVMKQEIFGPLLPVLTYHEINEVIQTVNFHAKPLALYYFTKDPLREHRILRDISYGGGCINDTIVHLATSHMPFGGVGHSGMGAYHGKASFETFTHKKSIMKKSLLVDIPIRYAPFKDKLCLLKKLQ